MYPEAIAYSERGIARLGRQTIHLGYLAVVYGVAGKKSETQKIISELKERSRHHYVFASVFGYAYLGLGDKDQALTFLERAYDEQDPGLFTLKVSPFLDPLRSEPRFQALLRRVNLIAVSPCGLHRLTSNLFKFISRNCRARHATWTRRPFLFV